MLFKDATGEAWLRMPLVDPERVRAPILHMIRREWVPREDPDLWKRLRHAERTTMVFEDQRLDHLDFQSIGFASSLVGLRSPMADAVRATFKAFNVYTLAFLDAHLKQDAKRRDFLARTPAENGLTAGSVTVERHPATPASMVDYEFLSEIAEGSLDGALAGFRRSWKERGEPPMSEVDLNLAGYYLLFGEAGPAAALRLFELNVEAHPDSANVYDSAGDAYAALGNREKALEYARRTLSLVDRDTSVSEERRKLIRQSAEEKIARLSRPAS
jgi:tetratricopeptide (TPR) repeat protein